MNWFKNQDGEWVTHPLDLSFLQYYSVEPHGVVYRAWFHGPMASVEIGFGTIGEANAICERHSIERALRSLE